MPNGGSDCCGTCWFNRANRGQAGSRNHDHSVPSHCEIRDVAIENPFYTYCANHPYRRPDRDPIPIGPILRPGTVTRETPEIAPTIMDTGTGHAARVVWKRSPDTEEVREHLLELLDDLERQARKDNYFPTPSMAAAVVWQLGEFRESRAIPGLSRIIERYDERIVDDARAALTKIRQTASRGPADMETRQLNHARQLSVDVLTWLRTTYSSHGFFLKRDVAWTIQKRLLDRICLWGPPYRVVHNYKVPKSTGRQFDLVLLDADGTVVLALKFQFEPAEKLAPGKSPVVEWTTVVNDIGFVQALVKKKHAQSACSLFIDESGAFRKKPAPPGSHWEDWDVGRGVHVAVLISEA